MSGRVIAFGEVMLRLKSPGFERLLQSPMLEATFGGGEANVALSLANFGLDVAYVTVLPQNAVADACIAYLRSRGVDTSLIVRGGERMGIYFLEAGAAQRPSQVLYDRAHSAIASADPQSLDWERIFDGASWFHVTGITPAISQNAADLSLKAVQMAKAKGLTVSCDYNYRKNLWKYG
ncbi:MAG TPA: sugar kinase, partial [Anaerolineae bacterium]|nr:sugar kinase [Anaerolineae bacterium]